MSRMNLHEAVQSQYLAALRMLREAIVKCPPHLWNAPRDKDKAWAKAYHAVYWAHKYLQPKRRDFVRWRGHDMENGGVPISKADLLKYLGFVQQQVVDQVPGIDFEADSGFKGFDMNKLEFHINNIRHIQQHTGELYERLGTRADAKLRWSEKVHRKTA